MVMVMTIIIKSIKMTNTLILIKTDLAKMNSKQDSNNEDLVISQQINQIFYQQLKGIDANNKQNTG